MPIEGKPAVTSDATAAPDDTRDLGEQRLEIRDVAQREPTRHPGNRGVRERQRERAAEDCEQEALGEELPDEARPLRT